MGETQKSLSVETRQRMHDAHLGKPNPHRWRDHKVVDGVEVWKCGRCGGFFPKDGFYKNKRTLLGITSECKLCHSRTVIRSRDKETTCKRNVVYAQNRRAKDFGADGRITVGGIRELLDILGRACLKCGYKKSINLDHIIPLVMGGTNFYDNLQPLCPKCNFSKYTETVDYRTDAQREAVNTWMQGFIVPADEVLPVVFNFEIVCAQTLEVDG